ncbi:MAG: dihydrodipicolinate synthase family protein [Tepidisphaeraceae bacterium]
MDEFTNRQPPRYPRCILGTCCIPWTADFQLDEPLLRRSVRHALTHGTRRLYLFGTAGEGHAVSDRQFQQITRAFADEMRSQDAEPMIGLISPSLAQVLDRIEWAAGIGVRQFQLSLPSWGTCTEPEAFTFFERVCTRFPECSFLHYNVRRAGRLLSAAEYGRLAGAFANLVAVKLAGAGGEDALAVQNAAPRLRLFLTEKAFAEGCALGVDAGFLISYASLNWPLAQRFFEAGVAGDGAFVAEMRRQQQGVINLMREAVGTEPHMDGAFDLMFVKRYLPEFPLRLLPPYAGVSDEGFARFIDGIRQTYPHWLDNVSASAATLPS